MTWGGVGQYILTEDGRLTLPFRDHETVHLNYKRKKITMWAANLRGAKPWCGEYVHYTEDGSDSIRLTYVVQIRNGRVSSIKETHRDVRPARPLKELLQ